MPLQPGGAEPVFGRIAANLYRIFAADNGVVNRENYKVLHKSLLGSPLAFRRGPGSKRRLVLPGLRREFRYWDAEHGPTGFAFAAWFDVSL